MSSGAKVTSNVCKSSPVLKFSMIAWEKIWKITHGAKVRNKAYECSSLGIMSPNDPCHLLDIYVPEQENYPSNTTICDADKNAWINEMILEGVDASQISLWHHTHADMGVFWSSTDVKTISNSKTDSIHWSVCTNVDGDIKIRADVFSPFRFWWDNCEYEIDYPSVDLTDWFKEQKVKMTFVEPQVKVGRIKPKNKRYPYDNSWRTDSYSGVVGYNFGRDPIGHIVEKSSQKDDKPDEILSSSTLQDAYNEGSITRAQALKIEKSLLVGEIEEDGVEDLIVDAMAINEEEEGWQGFFADNYTNGGN